MKAQKLMSIVSGEVIAAMEYVINTSLLVFHNI